MTKNVIDRITELMVEFPRLMHRRLGKVRKQASGINVLQIHAMVFLAENKGMTMTELAKVMQVSSPSATSFVSRLVKMGLVERQSDPKNRKLVRLHLTQTGEQALHERLQARNEVFAGVLKALNEKECLEFERLLKKILANVRDNVTI